MDLLASHTPDHSAHEQCSRWHASVPLMLSGCTMFTLEVWQGHMLCTSQPLLIVDDPDVYVELQQLQDDLSADPSQRPWIFRTMQDLGYWCDFAMAMRLGPVQVTAAEPDDEGIDLSSICMQACQDPDYRVKMLQTAANLLTYACDRAWPAIADYLMRGFVEFGGDVRQVVGPCGQHNLTLLHRYGGCGRQLVSAVWVHDSVGCGLHHGPDSPAPGGSSHRWRAHGGFHPEQLLRG